MTDSTDGQIGAPAELGPASDDDDAHLLTAEDVRNVAGFLFPFMAAHLRFLVLLAAALIVETLVNACFPLVQRYLIDHGLVARNPSVIAVCVAILAIAAISASALGLLMDYINSRVSIGVVGDLREFVFARCQKIGLSYYEGVPRGEILSRFSGDTLAIETVLLETLSWLILPLLQVTYSLSLMFYFNVWMGCLAALAIPIMLALPRHFGRKTLDVSYSKRLTESRLLAVVFENLAAQHVIRAFGYGRQSLRRFVDVNVKWRQTSFRAAFMGALVERSAFAGLYILHVGIFALGVWTAYSGLISIGTLIVFESLFLSLGESVAYAMDYVPRFSAAAGSVRHICELLAATPEPADKPNATAAWPLRHDVCFEQVEYCHAGSGYLLKTLNLCIRKGTKVAIVGPSGSGKSTLLGLLMRFHEPTSGRILFDGHDIREFTTASLRSRIGFVPQEPLLFHASIRDNIAVGNGAASFGEIERAAVAAEIDPFVRSLERGYETAVGEAGRAMSVGQRQRICLARALVRNPDILLLDEPTSAVDASAERSINQVLWRVGDQRTVVCATHRLIGVVDQADQIIVMNNGAIVETGTHAALLARGIYYGVLWHAQMVGQDHIHPG
jgi:ATP-binding cassette, subfamily B, bacterial